MKIRKIMLNIMQRVFGSALLFFGLNKIFAFLPLPQHTGFAQSFLDHLMQSGYIMEIIMVVQIMVGLSLLLNRYVEVALIFMFPISMNIFLFHFFHAQSAIIPATIFLVWNTVLMLSRANVYKILLQNNASLTLSEVAANTR